ncbi:MAG: T9SS type A sorting domain-containing protein [Bacteroidia bacterium]|nr:T9SS type A sorting domain-containing protein [Bacteroidia bacterium]
MKKPLLFLFSLMITGIATAQVTSGLVAKYSFNNANANDEAGTNNGTVNGATLTTDRFGNANKAYSFNGSAYIDCGNTPAIQNLIYQYSVSAWFKRSSASGSYEVIAAKWANNPVSEHFFLATTGSQVAWAAAGPGNNGTTSPPSFSFNAWHHAVFTWDSSGAHQVYIDNVLTTNTNLASHIVNATSPVNFLIGAQSPSFRLFNGDIDDARIYNRVLTATEVDSLFNEPDPMTIGINEQETEVNTITLFPNPASSAIQVTVKKATTVSVINVLGQEILKQNIQKSETISVSTLEPGIYFVKDLTSGFTKKFIKQ